MIDEIKLLGLGTGLVLSGTIGLFLRASISNTILFVGALCCVIAGIMSINKYRKLKGDSK